MAHQMQTRWEKPQRKLQVEEKTFPVRVKQTRTGARILTLLIVALVLSFVVWIPVEIWGQREAHEVAPQQTGQRMQSQLPAPAVPPSLHNGDAVPTTPSNQPSVPATAR